MNDYLWDKSGEPDADVQRLEELLGTLREERRPLVLPDAIVPARTLQPRRPFWTPLAIAAALALAALILLWPLLLRQNSPRRDPSIARQTAPADVTPQKTTPPDKTTPGQASQTATTNHATTNQATTTPDRRIEQNAGAVVAAKFRERATPRARAARRAGSFETSRAPGAGRSTPLVAVGLPKGGAPRRFTPDESQPHEAVAAVTLEQRQLAKEQLMLALRLTSAKLNLVQKKTQGTNESKSVPDEQNKLR